MASNTGNAALFGDSDSSDESVQDEVMKDAAKSSGETSHSPAKDAAADAKDTDPAETKPQSNAALFGDDSSDDEMKDDSKTSTAKDDDDAAAAQDANDETNEQKDKPPSNTDLFGDDSSDDDDQFDGNDGIIGKSATNVNARADDGANKPQTMNERLGLRDSDDENEAAKEDEQNEPPKPVYVPPRQMELLNLPEQDQSPDKAPSLHIVKLPNLVGINSTAYDSSTHNLEEEEEYYRGYVHNMIRWRYQTSNDEGIKRDENGMPLRESNTRLVKWSDGSLTLHVGNEVLEVDAVDSSIPNVLEGDNKANGLPGFAGINGYVYVKQKARTKTENDSDEENKESNKNDEEPAKETTGTVLECVGAITSRLAPRPSSLASEAHRNLTNAIRQRNVKRARIAEIVTDFDPEKEKAARIKGKDDLERSRNRGTRRSGQGGGGRRKLNSSYLEDDDEFDGVNLKKLKRQTMRRGDHSDDEDEMDYGDDSESEDDWSKNKKRKRGASAAAASKRDIQSDDDSSEEGEVVFGDDDEEDGAMFKKRGGGVAKKSNILDDDDD